MFEPNLSVPMRAGYVVIGVAIAAVPLLVSLKTWMNIAVPAVGVIAIVTGATGW